MLPWIFPQAPRFVARFVPGLEVLVASGRDTTDNPPAFLFPEALHPLTLILPHPSGSLWSSCPELPYQVSSLPPLGSGFSWVDGRPLGWAVPGAGSHLVLMASAHRQSLLSINQTDFQQLDLVNLRWWVWKVLRKRDGGASGYTCAGGWGAGLPGSRILF